MKAKYLYEVTATTDSGELVEYTALCRDDARYVKREMKSMGYSNAKITQQVFELTKEKVIR